MKQGGVGFGKPQRRGQQVIGALAVVFFHTFGNTLNAQPVVVGHRLPVSEANGILLQILPQNLLLGRLVKVYAVIGGGAKAPCKNQCKNQRKANHRSGYFFLSHG